MKNLVKFGPTTEEETTDIGSEAIWTDSAKAGASWVLGGAGRLVTNIVTSLPEFPGLRRMLDLGGGHGMFTIYMVAAHASMQGIVFDQPAVVDVARSFIKEYGMEHRVSVMGGDCVKDDIGEGYDLIWDSATLNFVKHDIDSMVRKIFKALNDGGLFITFQDGMIQDQTQLDTMLGHLGHSLTTGMDFCLDQGFITEAALRCGFQSVRCHTIKTPMGPMDMNIARKELEDKNIRIYYGSRKSSNRFSGQYRRYTFYPPFDEK
jgi:hypothetical protein